MNRLIVSIVELTVPRISTANGCGMFQKSFILDSELRCKFWSSERMRRSFPGILEHARKLSLGATDCHWHRLCSNWGDKRQTSDKMETWQYERRRPHERKSVTQSFYTLDELQNINDLFDYRSINVSLTFRSRLKRTVIWCNICLRGNFLNFTLANSWLNWRYVWATQYFTVTHMWAIILSLSCISEMTVVVIISSRVMKWIFKLSDISAHIFYPSRPVAHWTQSIQD